MRVVILGSGTAVPVPHRGPTSVWVREGSSSILIDCGSGSGQKLARAGGTLADLDAIAVTHAHLDHIGDLPSLLFAARLPESSRTKALDIVHSVGLGRFLKGIRDTFGSWLEAKDFEVRYRAVQPGDRLALGALSLQAFAVAHHESSVGLRLTGRNGAVLCVPSDTGMCPSLAEAARQADCLLIECSRPDGSPVEGHLTPSEVAWLAAQANPRAIVVMHQYPAAEKAGVVAQIASEVSCPVYEGVDGLDFQVLPGGVAHSGAVPSSSGVAPPDPQDMEALLAQQLEGLDTRDVLRLKYDDPDRSGGHSVTRELPPQPGPSSRRWDREALASLRLDAAQRKLLKAVGSKADLPGINLRGSSREQAARRLAAAIETWWRRGERFGRVVTGKGLRSEDEPVVKLATLDWLDGPGRRFVKRWAPEVRADGNFGSVLVEL